MIRVLVVDDSAVVRKILSRELERHDDIEVVGVAVDPYAAREQIARLRPDVLTLDIEMPRMDGLTFLEKLMKHHPLPVVVVSSVTERNSDNAVRALALGAVDVFCKGASPYDTDTGGIAQSVRRAAMARVGATRSGGPRSKSASVSAADLSQTRCRLVAIGASTGGPSAVECVLRSLPTTSPPVVIVQHMPREFTGAFAKRLDGVCSIQVREAKDGDALVPGLALVAPGDRHLVVRAGGGSLFARVKEGPRVNFHAPSVDVLFNSVARRVGADAIGVILTGMGGDGAKGLLAMREAGAPTVGQDEASCVIYGMPRVAAELGAVATVAPLERVTQAVLRACLARVAA